MFKSSSRHARTRPARRIGARLGATVLTAGLALTGAIGASTAAQAAPQSAYPRPVRPYVWHPGGFDDAATVYVTKRNGQLIPHCENVPLAAATSGDVRVLVRTELAPLFQALMRATEQRYGYDLRRGLTGAFSCRMIDGSANVSNHAYGRAIDMNWDENPMAKYFKSDIPPAVVKLWIDHGFYWGGHYTNKKDTMHFEYVAPIESVPFFLNRLKTYRG